MLNECISKNTLFTKNIKKRLERRIDHQVDNKDYFFNTTREEKVKGLETCQLTYEIWMIRSQLVVKLICMRLVN